MARASGETLDQFQDAWSSSLSSYSSSFYSFCSPFRLAFFLSVIPPFISFFFFGSSRLQFSPFPIPLLVTTVDLSRSPLSSSPLPSRPFRRTSLLYQFIDIHLLISVSLFFYHRPSPLPLDRYPLILSAQARNRPVFSSFSFLFWIAFLLFLL